MADAKDKGGAQAGEKAETGSAAEGHPGTTTSGSKPGTAAADAKRQDKTKDKPDSGQNEDG